jgi:phosphate/phosphite/phosphonate ABC transporter binding protein
MAKDRGDRYQTVADLAEEFCSQFPDARDQTASLRPGVHLEPAVPVDPKTSEEADSDPTEMDDSTIRDAEPPALEPGADRIPTGRPAARWRWPATVAALALATVIGGLAVWGWLVAAGWRPPKKAGGSRTVKKTGRGEGGSGTAGDQPEHTRDASKPLRALSFAIGYNAPPDLMFKEMGELVKYLSRRLGRRVTLVNVPPDRIAARLAAGTLDLGIFSPYRYVLDSMRYPTLQLLATHMADGSLTYEGYIVVMSKSPLRSLSELKGKRMCFVSRASTSGYLFPKQLLLAAGIDPDRDLKSQRFTRTHEAAIDGLLQGQCDAAAVFSGAYLEAVVRRGVGLRILATTDRIPNDAYCASPHLDRQTVNQVKWALQVFEPRRGLQKPFLGRMHRITGYVLVKDQHYDPIRRLHQSFAGKEKTAAQARQAR